MESLTVPWLHSDLDRLLGLTGEATLIPSLCDAESQRMLSHN